MAANLTPAFYRRLALDGLLGGILSRYNNRPAVFSTTPVPGNAVFPWILCEAGVEFGNFTVDALAGTTESRLIQVFDDEYFSAARAELLAARVRNLFTWSALTTLDFVGFLSNASPPVKISGKHALGRVVRVQLYKSTVTAGTIGFEEYEIPAEIPNGVLTNFSTTRAYLSGSLMVWANYPQRPGTDFTQDSDLMGFTMVAALATGTHLWVSYRYTS